MKFNILTAAVVLVLLCSLGGCSTSSASQYDNDKKLSASENTTLDRYGLRNGVYEADGNERPRFGTEDRQKYAASNRDLGKDLKDAGEQAKTGLEDATRDITDGIEDAIR